MACAAVRETAVVAIDGDGSILEGDIRSGADPPCGIHTAGGPWMGRRQGPARRAKDEGGAPKPNEGLPTRDVNTLKTSATP